MATPVILFDASAGPLILKPEDLGQEILLSIQDTTDVTSYQWTLLSVPTDSTAALSDATSANPTITADKSGTYLVKVAVNGGGLGLESTAVLAYTEAFDASDTARIPAVGEKTEASATEGWAEATDKALRLALQAYGDITRHATVVIKDTVTDLSAEVWAITGYTDVGGVELPVVEPADAETAALAYHVVLRPADQTGLVAGQRFVGVQSGPFTTSLTGTASVGGPVYLSTGGTLSLTPSTTRRRVGVITSRSGTTTGFVFNPYFDLANLLPSGANGEVLAVDNTSALGFAFKSTSTLQGPRGNSVLSGASAPTGGIDGDFFLDTRTQTLHGPKASGSWSGVPSVVLKGDTGPAGSTIHQASTKSDTIGVNGDYLLESSTRTLWGPKAANSWTGVPGLVIEGTQIVSYARAPLLTDGAIDDFYIDTQALQLYGPKTAATVSNPTGWGTGRNLKGDQGDPGLTPAGNWTAGTAYEEGDFVTYQFEAWACVTAHTAVSGSPPSATNTNWVKYVAKGIAGEKGETGYGIISGGAVADSSYIPTSLRAGDFYYDTASKKLWGPKPSNSGTAWVSVTVEGTPGTKIWSYANIAAANSASAGSNGDYLIATDAGAMYGPKASNTWTGTPKVANLRGASIYTAGSVAAADSAALGSEGDYLILTTTGMMYGPKAAGGWISTSTVVSVRGTQTHQTTATDGTVDNAVGQPGDFLINTFSGVLYGPKGTNNTWSTAGLKLRGGNFLRAATVDNAVGIEGDFLINTADNKLYGPKGATTWPTASPNAPVLIRGATIHRNAAVDNSIGENGDYLLVDTRLYGPRASGVYPTTYVELKGSRIWSGSAVPSATTDATGGVTAGSQPGDFYIRSYTTGGVALSDQYGPKTLAGWPASGTPIRGQMILTYGGTPPTSTSLLAARTGDWCIDTVNGVLYGPCTVSGTTATWPLSGSLRGADGVGVDRTPAMPPSSLAVYDFEADDLVLWSGENLNYGNSSVNNTEAAPRRIGAINGYTRNASASGNASGETLNYRTSGAGPLYMYESATLPSGAIPSSVFVPDTPGPGTRSGVFVRGFGSGYVAAINAKSASVISNPEVALSAWVRCPWLAPNVTASGLSAAYPAGMPRKLIVGLSYDSADIGYNANAASNLVHPLFGICLVGATLTGVSGATKPGIQIVWANYTSSPTGGTAPTVSSANVPIYADVTARNSILYSANSSLNSSLLVENDEWLHIAAVWGAFFLPDGSPTGSYGYRIYVNGEFRDAGLASTTNPVGRLGGPSNTSRLNVNGGISGSALGTTAAGTYGAGNFSVAGVRLFSPSIMGLSDKVHLLYEENYWREVYAKTLGFMQ